MTTNTLAISGDTPLQPLVLLVDTDLELLASRALLLIQSDYEVVTAKSPREIAELQCPGGLQIAVLTDALELAQLRASTESVRVQWPSARILILGYVPFALDDHLCDENVNTPFDPKKLLDTLKRLNQEAWALQSLSSELHLSNGTSENWDRSNHRRWPEESGPKKELCSAASASLSYSPMRALSQLHRKQ